MEFCFPCCLACRMDMQKETAKKLKNMYDIFVFFMYTSADPGPGTHDFNEVSAQFTINSLLLTSRTFLHLGPSLSVKCWKIP